MKFSVDPMIMPVLIDMTL